MDSNNPRGIRYHAEYIPDAEKMVKALKIVRDMPVPEKHSSPKQNDPKEGA
ncbi:hypothetical protein ACN6AX_01060 [Paenibacillus polymyxa]|uniref:hypothetical protein n=1 Tax=Paenibacillus polymyxa TaxID=1406 RepID=UPI00211D61B6|nr:hypothetical protein [Paenibacillus polymyxa]